jgi:ER membrane protein complex subunit 1
MKLVLGKHNLTAPITSYTRPEISTKSQSYFFTHSVKAIAVTTTARGITSKQILIGTISDQVYLFPFKLITYATKVRAFLYFPSKN